MHVFIPLAAISQSINRQSDQHHTLLWQVDMLEGFYCAGSISVTNTLNYIDPSGYCSFPFHSCSLTFSGEMNHQPHSVYQLADANGSLFKMANSFGPSSSWERSLSVWQPELLRFVSHRWSQRVGPEVLGMFVKFDNLCGLMSEKEDEAGEPPVLASGAVTSRQ